MGLSRGGPLVQVRRPSPFTRGTARRGHNQHPARPLLAQARPWTDQRLTMDSAAAAAVGVRLAAQLLAGLALLYAARAAGRWLYFGYTIRREVQRLGAAGVPTLPHSWLFGHLGVVAAFRRAHPADASMLALHAWLLAEQRRFFPDAAALPAVVHLDLWPALGAPLMLVTHPAAVAQFTQATSLPKAPYVRDALRLLTGARDIASAEGPLWRKWRARFNPGFGPRNIAALLPEMLEEAGVFAQALERLAGPGGRWGPVFQFEEKTTNLTLDIIVRACLYVGGPFAPARTPPFSGRR